MEDIRKLTNVVLKALALGMGVATVVLSALQSLPLEAGLSMLALGLTCTALAALQRDA
ncbi:MAG: hypothetical protein IT318_08090 [Anaerolineales bacterium]|nr:hypothetical protein [Anaerolineales bacterium]